MRDYFEVLGDCPLFDGVDEDDVRSMLDCMGARTAGFRKNAAIFLEGSPAESVGIVLSGAAQVVRDDFYGNRTIQTRLEPGDLFGETFACADVSRLPVTVEAVEDSLIMMIRLRRITQICPSACGFHHRVVLNLLRVMAEKNLRLNGKLEIASRRTTREKLMAYLLSQAKRAGSNAFAIPFDRQGLADFLGVDRSALSAEISKLRREGVLESERSSFRLLGEAR